MRSYTFVDYATQGYSLLVALIIVVLHNESVPHWGALVVAHVIGVGGVHALIQWHSRGQPGKPLDFLRHFYPVLLYTPFFRETGTLNRMVFPEIMDPTAIGWEQALFGGQPGVLFMDRMPYLWFSELLYASYFSYYLMIVGVGLALFLRERRQFAHYISVVSFAFYVCYLIYHFVPILGPRVFFREIEGYILPSECQQLVTVDSYPDAIKVGVFYRIMAWIYATFESPGAAFPSSHVAIAIVTLYFSWRYLPRIRYVHLLAVILLCASTVYCRYHYVVDVLAGFVTVAILLPLGNWLFFRLQGVGRAAPLSPAPVAPPGSA